ncbi:MAG: fasciclin domain-containing protein [Spirochaetales bacterium]
MTRKLFNRTLQLVLIIAAIVALVACASAGAGDSSDDQSEAESSLVEIVADTGSLSSLLTVIEYIDANGSQADSADLAAVLAGDGPFTVFAPNNAAFDALLGGLDPADPAFTTDDVVALQGILGSAQATADALYPVVANHVVPGDLSSSDLSAGLLLDTAAGTDYPFGLSVSSGVTGVNATFTDAAFTSTLNVETTNGIAHVIDTVLVDDATASALDAAGIELGSNIVELVLTTPSLSSLETVITYIDTNGSQATSNDLTAILAGTGPFTVFAPNNAAFDAALGGLATPTGTFDTADVAALEAALGGATATADALYLVVANHATNADEVLSNELSNGLSIDTLAGSGPNYGLTIDLTSGVEVEASATTANVVGADVQALNGVVHIIDNILLDTATAAALP